MMCCKPPEPCVGALTMCRLSNSMQACQGRPIHAHQMRRVSHYPHLRAMHRRRNLRMLPCLFGAYEYDYHAEPAQAAGWRRRSPDVTSTSMRHHASKM